LITKGYLKEFVKRHAQMEWDIEKSNQLIQALPKINVILRGTTLREDAFSGKQLWNIGKGSWIGHMAWTYQFHFKR
jgi:hypothetical protein